MKKLVLVAVSVVMIFGSCSKSAAPTASLKTDIDTISYELGMINSAGVKQYLSERLGVDTTYMDEFYKGLVEAANSSDNKKKAAYFAGIQMVSSSALKCSKASTINFSERTAQRASACATS